MNKHAERVQIRRPLTHWLTPSQHCAIFCGLVPPNRTIKIPSPSPNRKEKKKERRDDQRLCLFKPFKPHREPKEDSLVQ